MEVFFTQNFAARSDLRLASGQDVVVITLLPDRRIEDLVGKVWLTFVFHSNDRVAGDLFPIQEQRVAGNGDHRAATDAVIRRDDSVVFCVDVR